MSAYCSIQDMISRYGLDELARLAGSDLVGDDTIDDELIDIAINDASALIDSYLRGRYALPLAATPEELVRICCDLTRYDLRGQRGALGQGGVADEVKTRRETAIKWLEQVAKGVIVLDLAFADQTLASGGITSRDGARTIRNSLDEKQIWDQINGY